MRTEATVATLSLALLLGGCSKRPEPTASLPDDLKKDLAAASAASGDLATAPANYKRMRFVSDIEMAKASVPAKRPKVSHKHERMAASHGQGSEASNVALNQVASMASQAPAPISTPEAPAVEGPIAVAGRPKPAEPMIMPTGSSDGGGAAEHGHGGGIGEIIGGIFGGVVIRGGRGGTDKCDPRTDGRRGGTITDRPDFGMPIPTGGPTFPRRR
jgi:hypothetical protein